MRLCHGRVLVLVWILRAGRTLEVQQTLWLRLGLGSVLTLRLGHPWWWQLALGG